VRWLRFKIQHCCRLAHQREPRPVHGRSATCHWSYGNKRSNAANGQTFGHSSSCHYCSAPTVINTTVSVLARSYVRYPDVTVVKIIAHRKFAAWNVSHIFVTAQARIVMYDFRAPQLGACHNSGSTHRRTECRHTNVVDREGFARKVLIGLLLCAISVSSVPLWLILLRNS